MCALFDKEGEGVNIMNDPELSPAPPSSPVKYLVNVVKCSYPQSNRSVVAANKWPSPELELNSLVPSGPTCVTI